MSLVDPISDMLTRIRNAYAVGKDDLCLPASKVKLAVLSILKEEGYIEDFKNEDSQLCISLKYKGANPVIKKIERVSKPGRRVYVKKDEIPNVLSGQGIAVLSTSRGVMTGEKAKENSLGGELICKVY
jgi:small subunit ribosomal protein S8